MFPLTDEMVLPR